MIPLGLGLLIVGTILALLTGVLLNHYLTRERFVWLALLLGAIAFFVAGIVQNLLVSPVALAIHGPHGLSPLVPRYVWEALYYGLAAGIAQECLKLPAMALFGRRTPLVSRAIAVGTGFALAEIIFIALPALHGPSVGAIALALPVWERFSAILFHIGSALLIGYGLATRRTIPFLILAIVLHGIVDGTVGLLPLLGIHDLLAFEAANFLYSVAVLDGAVLLWLRSGHSGLSRR